MRKIAYAFLMAILLPAFDSYGYDDTHESFTDKVNGRAMSCGNTVLVGTYAYDDPGLVRECYSTTRGYRHYNGCPHPQYDFKWNNPANGSCDGQDTFMQGVHKWIASTVPGQTCWIAKCAKDGEYMTGNLGMSDMVVNGKTIAAGKVDYEVCGKCIQTIVEITTDDPTEYSYVKMEPDRSSATSNGCPANASLDNSCLGYKSKGFNNDGTTDTDEACVKRSCKCVSGKTAQEYKDNNDWMVRCS